MGERAITVNKEPSWQRKSSAISSCKCRRARLTLAPDRSRSRSARPQHHGILQGLQRPDAGSEPGLPIPVVITAFADKSFTFIMKTPPATILIKKAAGIRSPARHPHTDKVGKLTRAQCEEIAKTKMPDLTAADMDAACRTIAGSARSMGITVEVSDMAKLTKRERPCRARSTATSFTPFPKR